MAQLPVVLWTPKPAKSLVSTTMASNAHAFGVIFICEGLIAQQIADTKKPRFCAAIFSVCT